MDRSRSQRIKLLDKCTSSDSNSKANNNTNLELLLPEDLMFHIFTLVSPNCLLNSARYVCKPWAAAIASSRFAEACQHFHVRSKPGIYVENRKTRSRSYFLEFKDDVNDQFERTDLGTPAKMGHLIGTCDGIFLLNKVRKLFVVNPILKCWLRIPSVPISKGESLCTIVRVTRTAKFKLFHVHLLEVSGALWYVFYVLRIGIDNSWKEIARKQDPHNLGLLWKAIYSGANDLYWITLKEVIVMDVDREIIVREYPLPIRNLLSCPCAVLLGMGDRLSCIVYKYSYRTHEIYILDFDSGIWSLYHEMGPFDYVATCGRYFNTLYVVFRFWINDQIIFRVTIHPDKMWCFFSYNVKTKQLTKIEDIYVGNFEVWLHNNSLVSLPSSIT